MSMPLPLNLATWINEHRHLLKPPVGKEVVWTEGEFICMVVGGPNRRTDFHYDEGAEFFYQLEGDMLLRVVEEDGIRDISIREGEVFLLPPKVPHSPQRFENTVGLVIERQRTEGELDGLMWYCEECEDLLFEEYFTLENIETQFSAIFDRFYSSPAARTCDRCGHLNPAPEQYQE